ncbi:MAG: HypC/HybG/HupF family hydrogenase formation chaperone [Myxococcales bacterium]|nr:HypC/HybG/HupF family hydrogenase formation chaperone [Myxococcales bacterium]
MCLGIPMQVVEVDGFEARCEAKGVERRVSLFLVQHEEIQEGDHVLVHIGYAIQKLDAEDARDRWAALDLLIEASQGLLGHEESPEHA